MVGFLGRGVGRLALSTGLLLVLALAAGAALALLFELAQARRAGGGQ